MMRLPASINIVYPGHAKRDKDDEVESNNLIPASVARIAEGGITKLQ